MNTQLLIQLLVNGLVVGTLYGVVAMSFVLIYKATQVVNFAQGELLLIGAWVCWALLTKYQVPFWVGMPLTLVFMFVFGIAVQVVILRPMIGEPIISVIMVQLFGNPVFSGWTNIVPSCILVPIMSLTPSALPPRMASMGRIGIRSSCTGPGRNMPGFLY
jgi:branched-subunit amino acid ABC-type transport system permease component